MKDNELVGRGTISVISCHKGTDFKETVYTYYNDRDHDGQCTLNVDYDIEMDNGDYLDGTCFVDLNEALQAYDKKDFNELKDYFIHNYNAHSEAWNDIVLDFADKGLNPIYDESN